MVINVTAVVQVKMVAFPVLTQQPKTESLLQVFL